MIYILSKKIQGDNVINQLDNTQKKLEAMEGMSFSNINFSRYLQPLENAINPTRYPKDNLKQQQVMYSLGLHSDNSVVSTSAKNNIIYNNFIENLPGNNANVFSKPIL